MWYHDKKANFFCSLPLHLIIDFLNCAIEILDKTSKKRLRPIYTMGMRGLFRHEKLHKRQRAKFLRLQLSIKVHVRYISSSQNKKIYA